jgi:hemolysin activation/secretion protein
VADPATNLEQLHQALAQLQATYRQRGFSQATVTLPQQVLTDGSIVVRIDEGPQAHVDATPQPAPQSPVARTFEVRRYEVSGNTLLRQEIIDQILGVATGTNVTIQQIQKAVGELQLAYRERGFATVGVGLPQQQLTNATVRVQVTEGRLVDVRVTGNRYFSSNNVMRALPSVAKALAATNTVVNSRVFQRELDIANQNRDRQIYPTLSPGLEPETSALTLRVKDRLPLHGRVEVNNHSTPGTPDWRINASAQYNNLWQREHQFGLSYGFTPEEMKSEGLVNDYFFNRPLISYGGAYYRMPFGSAESVQERIQASPQFGYNEATHEFRLPPAGARPDLTIYASGSSSDTGVKSGPLRPIGTNNTPEFSLFSQDSGQNLSINNNLGTRFNWPAFVQEGSRWNFSAGLDFKTYKLTSYNTNNFYTYEVTEDDVTGEIIVDKTVISSPQPVRRSEVRYLPLSIGADWSESDARGSTLISLSGSYNFVGDSSEFAKLAYSSDAKASFGKVALSVNRDQKLFGNWSLLLRGRGQAASGPLISNEQFALGGLNSVRGYFEGDEYGDAGWFASAELRTPFLTARLPAWSESVPAWFRGSVFVDSGQRFLLEDVPGLDPSQFLWGAGFGLSANINNHVDTRIVVGWPLADSANTRAGDPRVYFSLGGQF